MAEDGDRAAVDRDPWPPMSSPQAVGRRDVGVRDGLEAPRRSPGRTATARRGGRMAGLMGRGLVARGAALLAPLVVAAVAAAEPIHGLLLPIDCRPGVDCWVLRYVDHDPGPEIRDYMCQGRAGDGHKGTDIALADLAAMAAGVEVRAAAAGVVDALRDGMADVSVDETGRQAVAGKECGNGIRLVHEGGWTTWYCHLRRSSLMVQEGDAVAPGQPLALVGMSGDTSFPHLHFEARHDDQTVDPFVGITPAADCGPGEQPLWAPDAMAQLTYQPILLTGAGFATAAPDKEDVRRGWHRATALPVTSPALVLWVEGYWVEPRDRVRFRLVGPQGRTIVERALEIERGQQRWLGFAGDRRPGARWPAGTYVGEIVLERSGAAGAQSFRIERRVELVLP
jgi:murein DD-endopeptidase MepM/ murein hydrolase activator NlpD